MPVIKSAIKKLRHDKRLEKENDLFRNLVEKAIKTAKKSKNPKDISTAFSLIDKAAKKHLFHKNKAARLKSTINPPKKTLIEEKESGKAPKSKSKLTTKTAKKIPSK